MCWKMERLFLVWMMITVLSIFSSCQNEVKQVINEGEISENKICQEEDGSISLEVGKAEVYHDMDNPSTNTAEWRVFVSKSGRYNVWLSSSTRDTTNLKYNNSVMLSLHDNRLEALPACDKIIQNSNDVNYPFYRADSFIGSLYIKDTGMLDIQLISEKIIPQDYESDGNSAENSKLISVFLTPITR